MDQLKLDAESASEMKAFYQEELAKAIRRIEHINKILDQLGESGARLELVVGDVRSSSSTSSPQKRKYKKKRGPKSKWDKVIIKSLKQAGKPLTYDELTDFLMISEGRDPSKRKNTKATVQNTVFRLRQEKKINTFSMGARIKYIAPSEWFEGDEIREEFKAKITPPAKKVTKATKGAKRGPGRPAKKRGPGRPAAKRGPGRPKKVIAPKTNDNKVETKPVETAKAVKKSPAKKKAQAKKKPTETIAKQSAAKPVAKAKGATKKKTTTTKKASPVKRKILMKKTVKK